MSEPHGEEDPGLVRDASAPWEVDWESHERAQRRRLAALPFALKLQWLEETHRLILQINEARERARAKN